MNEEINISIVELLSNCYYDLTSSEKKAADYVVSNCSDAQHLSITELSEACGVAEATISRFSRKLGFKGFNDFKLALARSCSGGREDMSPLSGKVTGDDSFSDVCRKLCTADVNAITQTLELISPEKVIAAADILIGAEKVICMGQGGSMVLAEEASHILNASCCKYFPVADSHTQAVTAVALGERDAILYLSYSGATTDMMQTLRIAKENEVGIVLITHYPSSPGARFADVVLQCGADESPLQMGSVAARISQLYLLDVLFAEICRRDMDACIARKHRIADVMTEKHL